MAAMIGPSGRMRQGSTSTLGRLIDASRHQAVREPCRWPDAMVREARRRRESSTLRQLSATAGIPRRRRADRTCRVEPRVTTLDRLLEACDTASASMPRLGIASIGRRSQERLSVPMDQRLVVAMADDAHYVSWRRRDRRVAECSSTDFGRCDPATLIDHEVRFVLIGGLAAGARLAVVDR